MQDRQHVPEKHFASFKFLQSRSVGKQACGPSHGRSPQRTSATVSVRGVILSGRCRMKVHQSTMPKSGDKAKTIR
jgi:hypothetical protein